jgi:hypothetical protein
MTPDELLASLNRLVPLLEELLPTMKWAQQILEDGAAQGTIRLKWRDDGGYDFVFADGTRVPLADTDELFHLIGAARNKAFANEINVASVASG